ncbi:hypothetical protein LDENG_00033210 [Lucifuga dentata]|nr:hypothetical protein LDENG_00033210 [Lucifuga dentata]
MKAREDEEQQGLLGLPEEESELDNLTEFNTDHNKRISALTVEDGDLDIQRPKRRRRRSSCVSFSEEEEVINPEDVDPSVGRFRGLIQKAVIPVKKEINEDSGSLEETLHRIQNLPISGGLCGDRPPTSHEVMTHQTAAQGGATVQGDLPHLVPNLAPEVDLTPSSAQPLVTLNTTPEPLNEPQKKKYNKEVWPGKKPTPSLPT